MNDRALIAMSGGVDSSVAAYLMKEAGFDCIGATMLLLGSGCCEPGPVTAGAEDARSTAESLGIPFLVFDFTDDFSEKVIDRFINAYERGSTPNPCVDCNRYIKFGKFFESAKKLGCGCAATGHYARIVKENGRFFLRKSLDPHKDQSYVLYSLSQEQLAMTRFPLGEMRKTEIRKIASELGFVNAGKSESQDICFAPDGNYAKFIEKRTGKTYPQGNFTDRSGKILGEHRGIIRYTVGQRRGLGLALSEPGYVIEKRSGDNTVVIGKNSELFSKELRAGDLNWITFDEPPGKMRLKAKIRYRQPEQWATVAPEGDGTALIVFDEPQRAAARGQAVVFYDGEYVAGGGTIM